MRRTRSSLTPMSDGFPCLEAREPLRWSPWITAKTTPAPTRSVLKVSLSLAKPYAICRKKPPMGLSRLLPSPEAPSSWLLVQTSRRSATSPTGNLGRRWRSWGTKPWASWANLACRASVSLTVWRLVEASRSLSTATTGPCHPVRRHSPSPRCSSALFPVGVGRGSCPTWSASETR